uniref:F-box domain-containing protein n=1 Tax=Mycena chlorophos TaxID=658473 RepID=A0ABQ0LTN0_MYCCL|nr:predicted protein [Mycena chlorophos]
MGTPGAKVYYWNGHYYIYYSHFNGYPQSLGVNILREIPRRGEYKAAYRAWRNSLRDRCEEQLKSHTVDDANPEDHNFIISVLPPRFNLKIPELDWCYTIDLEYEIFCVDEQPLFDLRDMPPSPELFFKYIGFDHYGHRSYAPSTPARHKWLTAVSEFPPPPVDDAILQAYDAIKPQLVSMDELLGVPPGCPLPESERSRIALYEILVGGQMQDSIYGFHCRWLSLCPGREAIPAELAEWGHRVLQLGIGPLDLGIGLGRRWPDQLRFNSPRDLYTKSDKPFWLAPNTLCVRFATHLEDERNVKAHVSALLDEMPAQKTRPVFGVICSFFHCVVVEKTEDSVKTTPALPFLPSSYANQPYTEGIAAIARLGLHIDQLKVEKMLAESKPVLKYGHFLYSFPSELVQQIAYHLGLSDLDAFFMAAPRLFAGANFFRRYPYVGECRLQTVLPLPVLDSENEEDYYDDEDHHYCKRPRRYTCAHHFSAVYIGYDPKYAGTFLETVEVAVNAARGTDVELKCIGDVDSLPLHSRKVRISSLPYHYT